MTESQDSRLPVQFDGKNYNDWSFRTEAYLDKEGVLELVETEFETQLNEFTINEGDSERVKKRKTDSKDELIRKNKKCRNAIIERVNNDVLEVIKDKKTAHEAWCALKERYEKTSVGSRIILSKKLSNMKYNPKEESFAEFNLKFDKIIRELKANGCNYDEIEKVTKLLLALPADYESVKDSLILGVQQSKLNLSMVRKMIDDFEIARKDQKKPTSKQTTLTPVAFMARGGLSRKNPMFKDICHNCKGFGHKRFECKKPGGGAFRGFFKARGRGNNYFNRGRGGFGRSQDGGEEPSAAAGHSGSSSYSGYKRGRGWSQDGRGRGRGYNNYRWNRGGGGRGSSAPAAGPKQETAAMTQMDEDKSANIVYSFMCTDLEVNDIIYPDFPLSRGGSLSSLSASVSTQTRLKFILDSGASKHLVQSNVPVLYKKRLRKPRIIQVAKTNMTLEAEFVGMLSCKTFVNGQTRNINIEVLLVEDLSHNLLSISSLDIQGYEITFKNGRGHIIKENVLVAVGAREMTNLYSLTVEIALPKEAETAAVMSTKINDALWHKRLGHLACQNLNKLSSMVEGMGKVKYEDSELCDVCVQGKQKSLPFDGTRKKTSRILERIHSDVCGPFKPTYDGKKYFLTFIDDFSHFVVVYGLSRKSQVYECFKNYFLRVTNRFGVKICNFRCDNGTEYINKQMMEYFSENGIKLEPNIPYTPEHNGVAERMNQTLLERARCLLLGSSLNRSFWFECILTAAYLINRSPTRAIEDQITPAEVWFGVKPDLSKLRVFGCKTYVKKPDVQLDGKFDSRSKKAIFLGYCDNGYRLWSVGERKVIVAKNIVCDESKSAFNDAENNEVFDSDSNRTIKVEEDVITEGDIQEENIEELNDIINNIGPEIEEFEELEEATGNVRRSSRVKMRPAYLRDYVTLASVAKYVDKNVSLTSDSDEPLTVNVLSAIECINKVPLSFSEVQASEDKDFWLKAIDAELQALEENGTWMFVKLPQGRTPIKTKWVFTIKQDADGKVDRYKARLVIKGCAQQEGIDYHETYAPVAHLATVRIFLCLVTRENLFVHQLDVKNAFLNGTLQEDIYMVPPEGLKIVPKDQVCKLKKALYGLKQAPFEWNRKFNECVKSMGFKQCVSDRCLYVKIEEDVKIYLLLYVDDFLIACKSEAKLLEVKGALMSAFKMRDLGQASYFLGIKIQQTNEGIFLSQQNHVAKVLQQFKMDSSKPVKTPLDVTPLVSEGSPSASDKPYRELVGSLMYTCMSTRPDICTAVNLFSQFQSDPKQVHWKGLARILRYLQGTPEWGLWYRGQSNYPLCMYVDADFANDPGRKSVTGFVIQVFGDSVAWGTRKQKSVALSTTEAEYIALATAVSELLWVRQLLGELGIENKNAIPVFEDNKSCITVLNNWEVKRMKHVDIKYNFVKDLFKDKIIDVKYMPTDEQTADIFTKGLPVDKFEKHRESLGMCIAPK